MTQDRDPSRSADDSAARPSHHLIRVEASALRDHGEPQSIDRVWDRLEPKLTLGRSAGRRGAGRHGKWPLVAAAVAAGFALGVVSSGWLVHGEPSTQTGVAPERTSVERTATVFAAGIAPRSYALPGGGTITLDPGSIVDTEKQDSGRLRLRLVRGNATLMHPGASAGTAGSPVVELMVGDARLAPAAGSQLRVRREGEHAFVEMLGGSADLRAPNADNEMVSQRLGADDAQRFRVRITTAMAPRPPQHHRPAMPGETAEDSTDPEPPEETPAVTPAWVVACQSGDDQRTLELLQQEPGALAQVTDPLVLSCVARGQRATGNDDAAIASYEKLMNQADTLRALGAVKRVQHMVARKRNTAKTDAERAKYSAKLASYAQREQQLALEAVSKNLDITGFMSAEGMCRRISAEAGVATPNWGAVTNLAAQYKKAFPTGECIATINGVLAKRPAPADDAEADSQAKPDDEDSPYEESGD